jgi:hypothetical protein
VDDDRERRRQRVLAERITRFGYGGLGEELEQSSAWRSKRLVRPVLILLLVLIAGAWLTERVWNGQHVKRLDLEAAATIALSPELERSARHAALAQVAFFAREATEAILQCCEDPEIGRLAAVARDKLRRILDEAPGEPRRQ